MKVYVVSTGIYDDYQVEAIFTTLELAKEFMAEFENDYNDIEVFELNPEDVKYKKLGYSVWLILMERGGTVERVWKEDINAISKTTLIRRRIELLTLPDVLEACLWARDEEHAISLVNEQRLKLIEEGVWE